MNNFSRTDITREKVDNGTIECIRNMITSIFVFFHHPVYNYISRPHQCSLIGPNQPLQLANARLRSLKSPESVGPFSHTGYHVRQEMTSLCYQENNVFFPQHYLKAYFSVLRSRCLRFVKCDVN